MAQITWRNINAPSFAGNAEATASASESIARGISGLGSLATKEGERRKESNTEALLRQIQGLDTAGLAEARSSGQFGAEALAGQNVDEGALFSALKGQDAAIERDLTAKLGRDERALTRTETPAIQNIQNLIAGQDYAGAKTALEAADIRDKSKLTSAITSGERAGVLRGRQDKDYFAQQKNIKEQEDADKFNRSVFGSIDTDIQTNEAKMQAIAEKFGVDYVDGNFDLTRALPTDGQLLFREGYVEEARGNLQNLIDEELAHQDIQAIPTSNALERMARKHYRSLRMSTREIDSNIAPLLGSFESRFNLKGKEAESLKGQIAAETKAIDTDFDLAKERHDRLAKITPTSGNQTTRQRAEGMNKVWTTVDKIAPDGSPWGDADVKGGGKLRTDLQLLSNESFGGNKVQPWMIEAAFLAVSERDDENIWHDPGASMNRIREVVENYATDTSERNLRLDLEASQNTLDTLRKNRAPSKAKVIQSLTSAAHKLAGIPNVDAQNKMLQRATDRSNTLQRK